MKIRYIFSRNLYIQISLVIICILLFVSCNDMTKNPIFSTFTTQSVAFTFNMTVEETRYQEFIKAGSNSNAVDSMGPIIFQPKTTVEQTEGTIYGNGSYTFTIYDRTNGDSLNMIEHYPSDTSRRVRKTILTNESVSMYDANDVSIGSTTAISMQNKFKMMIDSIMADSFLLSNCGQGMMLGSITNIPNLQNLITKVQNEGGTIKNKNNGLIEISMTLPNVFKDGSYNGIPNGKVIYLADTVNRKVLAYGLMSGTQAVSFTSYFYNQNTLASEFTETYTTLPDGTEMKNVIIKKYHAITINCELNN